MMIGIDLSTLTKKCVREGKQAQAEAEVVPSSSLVEG